ncbi:MAG: hypothetical protein ACTSUE_03565, partial [Promethearchaeota archaeon]
MPESRDCGRLYGVDVADGHHVDDSRKNKKMSKKSLTEKKGRKIMVQELRREDEMKKNEEE